MRDARARRRVHVVLRHVLHRTHAAKHALAVIYARAPPASSVPNYVIVLLCWQPTSGGVADQYAHALLSQYQAHVAILVPPVLPAQAQQDLSCGTCTRGPHSRGRCIQPCATAHPQRQRRSTKT